MSTNTTNYNLIKPAYSDTADIADINSNMDVIDAQLKLLADGKANQIDVSSINSESFNIAASSTGNVLFDVSRTGYTALGVVAIYIQNGLGTVSAMQYYFTDATHIRVYCQNITSSAKNNLVMRLSVLYRKNT